MNGHDGGFSLRKGCIGMWIDKFAWLTEETFFHKDILEAIFRGILKNPKSPKTNWYKFVVNRKCQSKNWKSLGGVFCLKSSL